jgi:hypothetical protein
MNNEPSRPHIALINCIIEVQPLLNTGECSGHIIDEEKLKEFDLKPRFILAITGKNRDDCLQKLSNKIKNFIGE